LDQRLGLSYMGSYSTSFQGRQEKWMQGTDAQYCILPNGELRRWRNSVYTYGRQGLVATLDASFYVTPSKLWNAKLPVTVSVSGNQLTLTPASTFSGTVTVVASVSDGMATTTRSFNVEVQPRAVILTAPKFSKSTTPTVTVGVPQDFGPVNLDIDMNRDGRFSGADEVNVVPWTTVTGSASFSVGPLGEGTYAMRARLNDPYGDPLSFSTTQVMQVDPNAGLPSAILDQMYAEYTNGLPGGQTVQEKYSSIRFDGDRVLVNVRAVPFSDLAKFQSDLEALGMNVVWVEQSQQLVSGYLPIKQIPALVPMADFS